MLVVPNNTQLILTIDSWETRARKRESDKIKDEFKPDDGDDEYLPEESYDEDEEDPDELSS